MPEPARWKNCLGDVISTKFGPTALLLFDEIIEPGFDLFDARMEALYKDDDQLLVAFAMLDRDMLRHATALGYCLAVQSLWERQLRAYLRVCAESLKVGGAVKRSEAFKWVEVEKLFLELRGVPLNAFVEYPDLNMLQMLGNACRHGDGRSLQQLWITHPELWPEHRRPGHVLPLPGGGHFVPTVDDLNIDKALLWRLVFAVSSFWEEMACIYMDNLRSYAPSALANRDELRAKRAGRRAKMTFPG